MRQVYLWGTLMILLIAAAYYSGWYLIQEQNDRIERQTRATICLALAHQQVVVKDIEVKLKGDFPDLVPICGATAEQIVREAETLGIKNLRQGG